MHRSRFAGLIIDCKTDDLEAAADFWSAALGYSRKGKSEDDLYVGLNAPENEPYVEVQKVEHPSRVHLDIEADDIEAKATGSAWRAQDWRCEELVRNGSPIRATVLHSSAGEQRFFCNCK